MSEFLFLRHGRTAGNLRSNYVGGRTDEPLCPAGIEALRAARAACPELRYREWPRPRREG